MHLGTVQTAATSDYCSTESVSRESCFQAVHALLPEGEAQNNPTLAVGSWNHVPQGCFDERWQFPCNLEQRRRQQHLGVEASDYLMNAVEAVSYAVRLEWIVCVQGCRCNVI